MKEKKKDYDAPMLEITEMNGDHSIASSGAGLYEEVWAVE